MRSFQLCSFEACKLIPYLVFRSTYLFVYFWLDCGCYSVPGKSVFYSNGVQGNSVQLYTTVYNHNSTNVWQSKSLPSQVAQPNSTIKGSGEPDYSEPPPGKAGIGDPFASRRLHLLLCTVQHCTALPSSCTAHCSSTLHGCTSLWISVALHLPLHFSVHFSGSAVPPFRLEKGGLQAPHITNTNKNTNTITNTTTIK